MKMLSGGGQWNDDSYNILVENNTLTFLKENTAISYNWRQWPEPEPDSAPPEFGFYVLDSYFLGIKYEGDQFTIIDNGTSKGIVVPIES